MLVRGGLAAAVGTVLHHTAFDKKGKSTAPAMLPAGTRKSYGTAQTGRPLRRASTLSESRSGERLDSVPENVVDIFSEADGERNSWNDGDDGCSSVNDEYQDVSRFDYMRTWRLYAILPIGSLLFLAFTALLPIVIAPDSRPSPPPARRLLLSLILSASLWCLGHSVRVPLFNVLNSTLSTAVFLCLSWTPRRTKRHPSAAAYIATFTSVVHVLAMAFLQESLRIASFAILDLHWRQSGGAPSSEPHYRARDAAFREVWALAFGWALAEVCAGIVQGYEQLALYADSDSSRRPSESSSKSGNEAMLSNGGNSASGATLGFDEEAADLVRWSMPCVDLGDDDVVEGVKTMTQVEIECALLKLANVRARDELEELYGQPYIEIPVFIILLQRLDSILLSLGNTLILAAAYLPKPPHVASFFSPLPDPSLPSLYQGQPASHAHVLPLLPTFPIVALVHTALGLLHAPPILARLGLPAAAYASCIVGLGVTFAGVGAWIGLW